MEELVSNATDRADCFIIFIYCQISCFPIMIQKNFNKIKGFNTKLAVSDKCICEKKKNQKILVNNKISLLFIKNYSKNYSNNSLSCFILIKSNLQKQETLTCFH